MAVTTYNCHQLVPNKIFSEFGRQMLIGPNPMSIHLCTGVGDRWKEAPTLPGHLFNGQTLEVNLTSGGLDDLFTKIKSSTIYHKLFCRK